MLLAKWAGKFDFAHGGGAVAAGCAALAGGGMSLGFRGYKTMYAMEIKAATMMPKPAWRNVTVPRAR